MNEQLKYLKSKYNEKLKRNDAAEEYFKTHAVKDCIKYLDLFNTVTKEISELIFDIENILGRKMTQSEKLNGFNL